MAFSLLPKAGLAIAVASALTLGFLGGFATQSAVVPVPSGPQQPTTPEVLLPPPAPGACSWHDTPFDGMDAAEVSELTLNDACGKVRGTVTAVMIVVKDEHTTYHFLLKPDAEFASMVNGDNTAQQGGALVIEVEPDDAFVMPKLHVDQHLEVEGPFVTDIDHGWNEIHPAKVITAI